MSGYWLGQENLLEDGQLEASSTASGVVGYPVKIGTSVGDPGAAAMLTQGAYTGPSTRTYTVEIDSIASGAEVGSATFRWKHSDSSGWEATGVVTSASWLTLENGVQIKWTSGTGDDFASGDQWVIACSLDYGLASLTLLNRDRVFRSNALDSPNWIKLGLDAAASAEVLIILDHNLTSGATITLKGNTSDSWTSPAWTQSIPWNSGTMAYFLDQSYQYWRLEISDTSNPDGFIELGELFLGTGLTPQGVVDLRQVERRRLAREAGRRPWESFNVTFVCPTREAKEEFRLLFDGLYSFTERRLRPTFFIWDRSDPDSACWLVEFEDQTLTSRQIGPESYEIPLNLTEVKITDVS